VSLRDDPARIQKIADFAEFEMRSWEERGNSKGARVKNFSISSETLLGLFQIDRSLASQRLWEYLNIHVASTAFRKESQVE